jgi:hypothetical protein
MVPMLCKDCAHFYKVYIGLYDVPACGQEKLIDLVDGEQIYRRCSVMRASDGKCGPEGVLFQPKS